MQKYNLQKNTLKETKILQDIITLEVMSSLNTKPKLHLSKNPRPIFHSWFSIEGFRVFEDHPCVLLV
jgi:hypothetical protein